jgi:hypothetical protein
MELDMAHDEPLLPALSPAVLQVIAECAAAMRADTGIDTAAVERLEKLLRQGSIPKPEEISAALFEPPQGGAA